MEQPELLMHTCWPVTDALQGPAEFTAFSLQVVKAPDRAAWQQAQIRKRQVADAKLFTRQQCASSFIAPAICHVHVEIDLLRGAADTRAGASWHSLVERASGMQAQNKHDVPKPSINKSQ